jgi:hypothetical protein
MIFIEVSPPDEKSKLLYHAVTKMTRFRNRIYESMKNAPAASAAGAGNIR